MSKYISINGVNVDEQKAQRLLRKIIMKEKRNIKTKDKSPTEMVRLIKKMIEEEVECY